MKIDTNRLIARIMRLSSGDLKAQWTTAGIIALIEEEMSIGVEIPERYSAKDKETRKLSVS